MRLRSRLHTVPAHTLSAVPVPSLNKRLLFSACSRRSSITVSSTSTTADDSAAHLLAQVIDRAKQTRTEIVVFGINDRIRGPLFAFDVLDRIPDDRIVATEKEARDLAWSLL